MERVDKNEMSQRIDGLKQELKNIQKENNQLKTELEPYRNGNFFQPIIPKKCFDQLKSKDIRRERKLKYWNLIDKAISNIVECKQVRITLTLGSEDTHLQWTEKEMDLAQRRLVRSGIVIPPLLLNPIAPNANGNFVHPLITDGQSERTNKHLKVTFTKKELCKTVITLDNERISQPAYHEMRMQLNPLMPPLSLVKEEKKSMSNKLNYYIVEGVRSLL